MKIYIRTISSSKAKSTWGELLSSVASTGPVAITRRGKTVAFLSPVQVTDEKRLAELAGPYSRGEITWRKIADETNAAFGELLVELGRQNLKLPRVKQKRTPEQEAEFDAIFAQAAAKKGIQK